MYKVSKLAAGSVIAATAALGGASVALADGYAAPRVAYERPSNWSGVYFGVQSGYQWSSIDGDIPGTPLHYSVNDNNAIVGAQLGYQHQFGAVVLGIEGNLISTVRDDWGSTTCPYFGAANCKDRLNDILTIGGRAGWAAGHWMPYVTGGYASARFAHEEWTLPGAGGAQTKLDESATRHDGWYLGGGVEWQISPGWTTGLEYRHYEFDTKVTNVVSPVGVNLGLERTSPTTDTVAARVSWRWGRPEAAPLK